jgi:hypothetical protein
VPANAERDQEQAFDIAQIPVRKAGDNRAEQGNRQIPAAGLAVSGLDRLYVHVMF